MTNEFIKGQPANDGIHETVNFNEYKSPEYWMRRRAIRTFVENLAPIVIVAGTLVAFLILGYLELGGI